MIELRSHLSRICRVSLMAFGVLVQPDRLVVLCPLASSCKYFRLIFLLCLLRRCLKGFTPWMNWNFVSSFTRGHNSWFNWEKPPDCCYCRRPCCMECLCYFPTANLLYFTWVALSMDIGRGTYLIHFISPHKWSEVFLQDPSVVCFYACSAAAQHNHLW